MASDSFRSTPPLISVEGADLATEWLDVLTSVRVRCSMGTVGRATLRFASATLKASGWYKIGAQVALKEYDGPAIFTGEVTGIAVEMSTSHVPELVVTVDDPAYKLSRVTVSRTFLNQSYADIAKALISGNGVPVDVTIAGGAPEYTLQSGTDLDFLDAVTRRTDTAWWFDPVAKKLTVKTPTTATPAAEYTMGVDGRGELTRFSVRASVRNVDKVVVRGWDPDTGEAVSGESDPLPSAETDMLVAYPGRGLKGTQKLVVTDLGPATQAEAKTMATALAREARSEAMAARGETVLDGRIAPGASIKVTAEPVSGTYLVTAVEHVFDHRGSRTSFEAGSHRPSGLVDVLGTQRPDPGFSSTQVMAAVVTDISDEKAQLRVKVRYPMPQGKGGDVVSHWARVLSLGGGPERGMVFLPEIDDEVLIAFEGGNTSRPVVLGGLFSDKNALPTGAKAIDQSKVNYRRIASRTGNLVELSDEDGKEHVLIKHGKQTHTIKLDKAGGLEVNISDGPIKITNGKATLELTKEGDIKLTGGEITVKAQKNITLEATQKLSAKGTTGVAIQGLKVDVKSDAAGSVEAGGPLTVKGATVAIN